MEHIGQKMTILLTLTFVAGIFIGRGYEQAKVKYAIWRESDVTAKFGRSLKALAALAGVGLLFVFGVYARR